MKKSIKTTHPDKKFDQPAGLLETFEMEKQSLNARVFLASSYCRGTNESFLYAFGCE